FDQRAESCDIPELEHYREQRAIRLAHARKCDANAAAIAEGEVLKLAHSASDRLWARSMTARFSSKLDSLRSAGKARGHRPRPQSIGCASRGIFVSCFLLFIVPLLAQDQQAPFTISVRTQLVVQTVSVTDKDGKP